MPVPAKSPASSQAEESVTKWCGKSHKLFYLVSCEISSFLAFLALGRNTDQHGILFAGPFLRRLIQLFHEVGGYLAALLLPPLLFGLFLRLDFLKTFTESGVGGDFVS